MAEQHSQTADYVNRWKFTGHELDRETGLYYANARYYDPKVSIFLSVDPLADHPNQVDKSPYAYAWNNPINLTDPDGRCPDCPENPTKGQTHNSSEFGELTFNGQTWNNDNYNIIPMISIEGTSGNNSDLGATTTTAQLSGGLLFNSFKDMSSNYIDKSLYYKGSYNPLNSIDFNSQNTLNAGVNVYEKGYKESIKKMSNLNKVMAGGTTTLNGLGYIHGGVEFYNGNYAEGVNAVTGNTVGILATNAHGWKLGLGYGLLYNASYMFFENNLPKSETYNRMIHGENSPTYKSRRQYWFKSKLYTGEQ